MTTRDERRFSAANGWRRRRGYVFAVTAAATLLVALPLVERTDQQFTAETVVGTIGGAAHADGPPALLSDKNLARVGQDAGLITPKDNVTRAVELMRQAITMRGEAAGRRDQRRTVVRFTSSDAQTAHDVVVHLADRFVVEHSQPAAVAGDDELWQQVEQGLAKHQVAAERLRRELGQHAERLRDVQDSSDTAPPAAVVHDEPVAASAMIPNPERARLQQSLLVLQRRRAELLADRTELHPEVRHNDAEVEQVIASLEQTPGMVATTEQPEAVVSPATPAPAAPRPAMPDLSPSLAQLERLGQAEAEAQRQLHQVVLTHRETALFGGSGVGPTAWVQQPAQIVLHQGGYPTPTAVGVVALVAGLIGLIVSRIAGAPLALQSVAHAAALVPAPVTATLATDDGPPIRPSRRAALGRMLTLTGEAIVVAAVLLTGYAVLVGGQATGEPLRVYLDTVHRVFG